MSPTFNRDFVYRAFLDAVRWRESAKTSPGHTLDERGIRDAFDLWLANTAIEPAPPMSALPVASSQCPICGRYHPHSHAAEEPEWEASLRRAFVDKGMTYIGLDGWSGEFLVHAARYGRFKGWLDKGTEAGSDMEQYTELVFRLTDFGKQHFSIPERNSPDMLRRLTKIVRES